MHGRWLVLGLGVTLAVGYGVGQWQLVSVRTVVAQEEAAPVAPANVDAATELIDADPLVDAEPPAIPALLTPAEAAANGFETTVPVMPPEVGLEVQPLVPQEILLDTPEAQAAAQTELEKQYLEASREIFRSLTEQQQRELLAATLAQLKQAQAMGRLAKLKAELQTLASEFPQTEAARMALDAAQRLEQPTAASSFFSQIQPLPKNDPFNVSHSRGAETPSAEEWKAFLKLRSLQPIPEDSTLDLQ